jgi:hypothetical protein
MRERSLATEYASFVTQQGGCLQMSGYVWSDIKIPCPSCRRLTGEGVPCNSVVPAKNRGRLFWNVRIEETG